jgi:hypothetical protein
VQFFSRVFGAASKTSRVRRADRSPRSRCAQIGVESLEARDLKSDIPGVSNQAGVLVITATQDAHNTAIVSPARNGNVQVTVNGNSEMFPAGALWTISYTGAQGGENTFINNTGLSEVAVMNGGGNRVVSGSSWNLVELWGNYNSFNAQGGVSNVYCYNGPNDNINTSNGYVNASSYDFSGW